MLLGKLPGAAIKRTTSMKGINVGGAESSDPQNGIMIIDQEMLGDAEAEGPATVKRSVEVGQREYDHRLMSSTVSPRYHRRSSGDHIETADFLRWCGLCKRRLAPGRDIYMYRGDTAFCSRECREQQIKHDAREKREGVCGGVEER